jgi:hypothetical protein
MEEDAVDRTMWRACFGRGLGPVVRQTVKWMNERISRQKTKIGVNIKVTFCSDDTQARGKHNDLRGDMW